jgi:SAM-dependent methyltransferase
MCSEQNDWEAVTPMGANGVLENVICPTCRSPLQTVVRPSVYGTNPNPVQLMATYSASSEATLQDQLVSCQECGLVYVSPRLRSELITASYEVNEDVRHFKQNQYRIRSFQRALSSLSGQVDMREGMNLLDIGCAGGSLLVAAGLSGLRAEGVEPSRQQAEFARSVNGVSVRTGFFSASDYGESQFDFVSLWDVLEHVPDPRALISGAASLLRPEGHLILNLPMIDTVPARLLGIRWPFYLNVHLWYFTMESISRLLDSCGFRIVHSARYWQTLSLDYVSDRAGMPLIPRALAQYVPCRYYLGQRTIVAAPNPLHA